MSDFMKSISVSCLPNFLPVAWSYAKVNDVVMYIGPSESKIGKCMHCVA